MSETPELTKQQIAFAQAYQRCEGQLLLYKDDSTEYADLTEQMILLRYWYGG